MLDLLLRNARVRGSELTDIGVREGRIVAAENEARQVIDIAGDLVTPALVEPHVHLDSVLTLGEPRHNMSGTLLEGIDIFAERGVTAEDIDRRARTALRWYLVNGVQFVRDHVDICDPNLTGLEAILRLREELRDEISIQVVAFPQLGILAFDNGEALMRRAAALGVDALGAIPHFELTRTLGEQSIAFVMDLASEYGLMVDIHCDENDDEQSRFLEVVASESIRLGMKGKVTVSHVTAMHSYNNSYASRLIANVARADVNVVTNPLVNSVLQGRSDNYPIRRGHTRVKELLAAGVNVSIGSDSIMDSCYPFGRADPIHAAHVWAHYGHMTGYTEIPTLFDMITVRPARTLGLVDYGIEEGMRADLVVFAAPTELDAVRLLSPRRFVIRGGRIVAHSEPAKHSVLWGGREETVDFLKPNLT